MARGASEETSRYTSIYLDPDSRATLDRLAVEQGASRSHVVRGLIAQADDSRQSRLSALVSEMADLLHIR